MKSFKQISDIITDCIEPSPVGLIEPVFVYDDGKTLIKITVKKGLRPLYCIKKHGYSPAGCFLRIGSTCKSMTADEIQRRYIQNLANSDLMISSVGDTGNLSFNTLKNYYYENGYHLEEDFFRGISCPRNDALMRIFNNMHISEHTGHGIPVIVRKYGVTDCMSCPWTALFSCPPTAQFPVQGTTCFAGRMILPVFVSNTPDNRWPRSDFGQTSLPCLP